ncbi:MAG: glycosyltransferase family 39 protein [Planctomycetota bacterium]|nr:glycosyltransferase family 39 protein [Planctomycetota bacterium]
MKDAPLLAACVLMVLASVALLPGIESIPVIDRDEARFAQASRQMLDSGTLEGWMIPRVGEQTRLSKPPLIYWLQAGTAGLASGWDTTRDAIWMYRLPSVLAAFCTILMTWRLGVRMFGRGTGFLAGCMLAVCPLIAFDGHMARADELMVALTTAAMVLLYLSWEQGRSPDAPPLSRWLTSGLWVLVGLGMLAKGPITPLVVVLSAVSLAICTARWHWLLRIRPFTGILIALCVFIPWVVLASQAVGFETLRAIAYDEIVVRSSTGRESHGAPPGYHLVLLVVLLWPGSLLTGLALGRSWRRAGRPLRRFPARGHAAEAFCLAWIVPSWIVFELAATKLPHYTLPLYPAVALISARALLVGVRALPQSRNLGARIGFTLWLVIGLVISALPILLLVLCSRLGDLSDPPPGAPVASGLDWPIWTLVGLGTALGVGFLLAGYRLILEGRFLEGQLWSLPTAALSMGLVFGVSLPHAWPIWITPRLEAIIEAHQDSTTPRPLAAARYVEDSLMYASRGRLQRIGVGGIPQWSRKHPDGLIVVPVNEVPNEAAFEQLGRVRGFSYSKGETMDLVVIRRRASPSGE